MTLVNVRAAFEKAVTDQVTDNDPTIKVVYDNVPFKVPSKTTKYVVMNIKFWSINFYKIKVLLQIIMLVLFNVISMYQK